MSHTYVTVQLAKQLVQYLVTIFFRDSTGSME
jgi:hypothetical protein